MEFFTDIILPVALLLTGIFLTIRLDFVQVRYLFSGLRNMLSKENEASAGVSPFSSLMSSLAAQLGTGNIVGAGSAIITGGPGAVFWMWVSAFFGMATAYSEASLAIITRKRSENGEFTGGAPYYILSAFEGRTGKLLSGLFSLFATIALGFTGVAVQSNSISSALREAFGIPLFLTGIAITAAAAFFILRGTRAVTGFAEKTIPLFGVLYTLCCVGVIIFNIKNVPEAVRLIFVCAFSHEALFGGITGIGIKEAVTQGIKRGLFTNEAGMGSSPAAHALSSSRDPHFQGTLGIAGVFIDTFLMLGITALGIITVLYTGEKPPSSALTGSRAVTLAVGSIFGTKGAAAFIAFSVLFFAFASILGWNLYGKASAEFLFGKKSEKLYLLSSLFFTFLGCIMPVKTVWTLTDIFNALMVLTNTPALIRLSGKAKAFIPVKNKIYVEKQQN